MYRIELSLDLTFYLTFHVTLSAIPSNMTPLYAALKHNTCTRLCVPGCRYDYEGVDAAAAEQMMTNLNALIASGALVSKQYTHADKAFTVASMDNFEYTDPIDHSVSKNQVKPASLLGRAVLVFA